MDYRDWIIWALVGVTTAVIATSILAFIIHLAALETESLYTEDMMEARQFQRECLRKTESKIELKELVNGWQFTCYWTE